MNTGEISDSARRKAHDFIENEGQFHLGFLPTEQSNPITATLEEDFKRSTLVDRSIRLLIELGHVSYEEAARRVFAAEEWVARQDWAGREEPSPVQVALATVRAERDKA